MTEPVAKVAKDEFGLVNLKDTHPYLYKQMMLNGLVMFIGGLVFFFQAEYLQAQLKLVVNQFVPLRVWAVLFIISGLLMLYGSNKGPRRYKLARAGLYMAAGGTGVWALGYLVSLFLMPSTILNLLSPTFWGYICGTMVVWAGEPAFNPLSAVLNKVNKEKPNV